MRELIRRDDAIRPELVGKCKTLPSVQLKRHGAALKVEAFHIEIAISMAHRIMSANQG